ncbi:glycosyltransferase family 2 protein [bacterium]|nr:glycosyltransferase family 2 protein [bacterium]
MKLSIITCTYNREKCLQQCIDSVIAQNLDLNTYEHIFVDAYSKDKTKTIIKNYMAKYKNVRLIEREPK